MKPIRLIPLVVALVLIVACGGGGGSVVPSVTLSGTVLWLPAGGAPNPGATVQVGNKFVLTNTSDGSFSLAVPRGTSSITVAYTPPAGAPVSFLFEFPAAQQNTDIGDLVIGPSKVVVTGRVVSAADNSAVPAAAVSFAGRSATSNAQGVFNLSDVAYDPNSLTAFLGLEGRASKTGFFPATFNPSSGATNSVVNVGDAVLPVDSGSDPPSLPGNLVGTVRPQNLAAGTLVKVFSGNTQVRQATLSADGQFAFWLAAGTYTITYNNPTNGTAAADKSVSVSQGNTIVRADATLE